MKQKVFWGILLLLTAISLILYGIGLGPSLFGMPIHKLFLAIVFIAIVFSKIVFSDTLREKAKIFTPLSFLFMVLEPHIATWFDFSDENIINNWLLLLAAILLDTSMGFIIPKKHTTKGKHDHGIHIGEDGIHVGGNIHIDEDGIRVGDDIHIGGDGNSNFGNSTIHYADVSEKRYHYYMTKMGSMNIYYQNAEMVETGSEVVLELKCTMGSIVVTVPEDWNIIDEISTNMASTVIRESSGNRVTLRVKGTNKMGSIVIE